MPRGGCLLTYEIMRYGLHGVLSLSIAILGTYGCAAPDVGGPSVRDRSAPEIVAGTEAPPDGATTLAPPGAPDGKASTAASGPGAPPSQDCHLAKGTFLERQTAASSYVLYVPEKYDGRPSRLLVGLHGCGDTAWSFAEWAVNPDETRDAQTHIGIAVEGASGDGNCWLAEDDAPKVLAAIEDIASCVYVHRQQIVLGGFSSGGLVAYWLGLTHADRFAGLLVSNAALSGAGDASSLLARASWKIPIAHRAHEGDDVFPIDQVRTDWDTLTANGYPLVTSEVAGGHDGTSDDWAQWLIPQMQGWQRR